MVSVSFPAPRSTWKAISPEILLNPGANAPPERSMMGPWTLLSAVSIMLIVSVLETVAVPHCVVEALVSRILPASAPVPT